MQPAKISVDAVAAELDGVGQDIHVYLHKATGEFVSLSTEELSAAEEGYDLEDYPDWQRELIQMAAEVLDSDGYVELPTAYDIHEYAIMENFCWTLEPEIFREDMLNLIRGSGAFRRFKGAIYRHGIEDAWFAFRAQALLKIARDWLENNEIPFIDEEDEETAEADEDSAPPASVAQTPGIGKIIWQDLTVRDATAVRDFYSAVVGWEWRPHDMGDYADFDILPPGGDQPVTGICHARGWNANLPAQWLIYISVADVDASAARCVELGGKILDGPRDMGSARFCVIQDPAGAVCALMSQ